MIVHGGGAVVPRASPLARATESDQLMIWYGRPVSNFLQPRCYHSTPNYPVPGENVLSPNPRFSAGIVRPGSSQFRLARAS